MPKRILKGVVLSDKVDKTITVLLKGVCILYKKYINRTKKYSYTMKVISLKLVKLSQFKRKANFKNQKWIALKVG